MLLALVPGDFLYDLILFLHILAAIVGFGSTFVWPFLAAQSRAAGPPISLTNSRISLLGGRILSTYFIYTVGVTGLLLVLVTDNRIISMGDAWISIAFLLYLGGLAVNFFLHQPNLRAMVSRQEEMASGAGAASSGPPPQAVELADRGRKAQMYGGILHLLFALTLLDMVFKPGA